jgi:hypothetical protein
MEPAYRKWQGILTLKVLSILKNYGRFENDDN